MAEEYTLTTPEVIPEKITAKYKVVFQTYDWRESYVFIRLEGENGEQITATYGGGISPQADKDKARDMMRYLNTANCSTKSQQKRICEQLQKDGKIPPGTVTGTPDPPPTALAVEQGVDDAS